MIYLDYSATTPPNEQVIKSFEKASIDYFANSNSLHSLGTKSKELEEYVTKKIEKILKLHNKEIIYTSGASESNNQAIKGLALKYQNRGRHIITSKLEHSSIKKAMDYLKDLGFTIDYVNILDTGEIDLQSLKELINDKTILVSISAVDSELGIKQPLEKIEEIIKEYPKCYLHVDCTQAIGKINIDFSKIDLASISGHKIFGLKGIGLLIKNKTLEIEPLIHGGASTTKYRSGTPALPLMVSIMKALELIIPNIENNYKHVKELNQRIVSNLKQYPNIHINSTELSIPYIINFSVNGIKAETLLHSLEEKEVYISTKSACSSKEKLSDSVFAVTKNEEYAINSLRISLAYLTTEEEIEKFLKIFSECYHKLELKK